MSKKSQGTKDHPWSLTTPPGTIRDFRYVPYIAVDAEIHDP